MRAKLFFSEVCVSLLFSLYSLGFLSGTLEVDTERTLFLGLHDFMTI